MGLSQLSPTAMAYSAVLALNVLWFGVGFWYFSLTSERAANLLVPKSARNSPLFKTMSASVRFLGGMNFAFAVFAALLLATGALFPDSRQRALFAAVFSIAHASQFVCNVPVALAGGRQGESLWHVLKGPMLFIFSVDFVLMLANGVLAVTLLVSADA